MTTNKWAFGILMFLLAMSAAMAEYNGRLQPSMSKDHVVVGYRLDTADDRGAWYRENITAADSGEIGTIGSGTQNAPIIYTGGWAQVGLACTSNVATFQVTLTPAYGCPDSSGEVQWHTGSDVTLTCDSEYTFQSAYTSGKAYVDTDGVPFMRILVKSLSSGDGSDPVAHKLVRLSAKVN